MKSLALTILLYPCAFVWLVCIASASEQARKERHACR